MNTPRLLLIEDDDSLREVMSFNLEDAGYLVDVAATGEEGVKKYEPRRHDVVITDLRMPGIDGLEVIARLRRRDPLCVVVVMTAYGGTQRALDAMRQGAFHYIEKPVNSGALRALLERAVEFRRVRCEHAELKKRPDQRHQLIASSSQMSQILRVVDKVADSDATVLIIGESGTGKELIARLLHERSSRRDAPFVTVNCAAIPGDLLESTLFGHTRGAFTGAHRDAKGKFRAAHRGTLLLDEIAELPLQLQSKLLRVLQEGEVEPVGSPTTTLVDVRVLAATHCDLEARVHDGLFREDLYWRLNVVPIPLPPLRERPEDIPPLVRFFLRKHAPQANISIAESVDECFLAHPWPGNVRELENTLQRMLLLRESDALTGRDLPARLRPSAVSTPSQGLPFTLPEGELDLRALERDIILAALEKMDGNQSATARYLKIPRHVLTYRLDKYGITR